MAQRINDLSNQSHHLCHDLQILDDSIIANVISRKGFVELQMGADRDGSAVDADNKSYPINLPGVLTEYGYDLIFQRRTRN